MIYEFGRSIVSLCKCIRHFFRALFCKDYYTESHGLGMCGKYGTSIYTAHFCDCVWCPKVKGADDEDN